LKKPLIHDARLPCRQHRALINVNVRC
jgi:hypothetical protein